MEVTLSLLVAMMFIMILSIGIGVALTALASFVDRSTGDLPHLLIINWILILLMMHLDFFWQTITILEKEQWIFAEFLYVVCGPILLYLAVSIMTPSPDVGIQGKELFFFVARRFFVLLAILMFWPLGVDLIFGRGVSTETVVHLVAVPMFLYLAFSENARLHIAGITIVWFLVLSVLLVESLGTAG